MADRELVIKIPEELLRYFDSLYLMNVNENKNVDRLVKILKNGTPLPKGHEKLIAEPTEEDIAKTVGGQNDFTECIKDAVKAVFDNADAIIEADKENE